jgi:uncharacterized phage protein gp47/JayE
MAGLTADGFTIKTISEIQEEMAADLRARLGPELDTSAESVMGQIIGAFAEREASVWLAARDVWQAFTPAGASGVSLTQLSLITGTLREDETRSRVTATLHLNAGITVPAGSRVRVVTDETAVFETLEDVTNAGGSPAYVDAVMQAVDAGPVRANAGTLTVIVTPVSGWNSATNAEDADMGLAAELDPELRARRERELRVQGSANIDAIEQDVLQVEGVIDARGFENDTDNTVGDLPPHSFRIVVWDGDPEAANDDEIAQAIWDSKPIGIEDVGADFGFALDRRGDNQTVQFARAALAEVYLEFDVEVDSSKFPADGADQIEAAVVAYADENWRIGEDVILSALYAAVFSVSGVRRIAAVRAGLAPSPVGTSDLTVGDDEIARADTGRILVNVS